MTDHLTSSQVAAQLGVTRRRVVAVANLRKLGTKLGRDWMFSPADVAAMRIPQRSGPKPKERTMKISELAYIDERSILVGTREDPELWVNRVELLRDRGGREVAYFLEDLNTAELAVLPDENADQIRADWLASGTDGAHNGNTGQPDPESKSGQIRAYLLSHYPCQEVPRGALTEIANRFGVTKELVRHQSKKLAYTRAEHIPAVRLCECGQPALNGGRCAECRFVTVACEICGRILRRDRTNLMNRIRRGESQSIVCSSKDLGLANHREKTECAKERIRRIRADRYWSSVPKK